ncbi:MAG: hypothetical protein MI794_16730 [Pseudomonadales bacterium]|nr:hypothetical protein [Pseudomonadales bacterium]
MFSRIKTVSLKLTPVVLGMFLVACSGGGGGSSSGNPSQGTGKKLSPGGYLTTITSEDGSIEEAVSLLSPTGKFVTYYFFDDISIGTLEFGASGSISGSGQDIYFDGTSWQSVPGSLSGQVETPGKATLSPDIPGVETSAVFERENQFSDSGITMMELSGTYSMSGSIVHTTAVTIAEDGTLTGSDETGCVFNGSTTIPETQYNVFELIFEASNCSDALRNGRFAGLGAYDSELGELSFAGTDNEVTAVFIGTK